MDITGRDDILRALGEADAALELEEIRDRLDVDERSLDPDVIKAALDGLTEAGLVIWEARGEITWRISMPGRDSIAGS